MRVPARRCPSERVSEKGECRRPSATSEARNRQEMAAKTVLCSPVEQVPAACWDFSDTLLAMESLVLIQAHRAQGRTDGSTSRSENGACHEHVNMLEDTL